MNSDFFQVRWLVAVNDHSEEIPAYGCVEVTDASVDSVHGRIVLNVTRPTEDSIQPVAVNSWKPIPAGEWGQVTFDGPAIVLYDSADTPGPKESWGAQADSFEIKADESGFRIIGAVNSDNTTVLADMLTDRDIPDDTGTGTGTGTDDVCIARIGGYRLDELAITGNPRYALGIDEAGCMVLIPVGDCDV